MTNTTPIAPPFREAVEVVVAIEGAEKEAAVAAQGSGAAAPALSRSFPSVRSGERGDDQRERRETSGRRPSANDRNY